MTPKALESVALSCENNLQKESVILIVLLIRFWPGKNIIIDISVFLSSILILLPNLE